MNGVVNVVIDGFRPEHQRAFDGFDPVMAGRVYSVLDAISRTMRVEVDGLERIPAGGALIVANHAFGWDVVLAMTAVWQKLGRPVWALGEHAWWKVPFLRRMASAVGTVDGTPENADRLLSGGELVLVLPGGLREAVKPRELRYRLLWGHRYGFVHAALRNGVPIVPMAAIGADDFFDFVGDAYRRGEKLLRRRGVPLPLPARLLPIPHLVKLRYVFGEPIPPRVPPDHASDEATLRSVRHEVEGELHELIETALAARAGIAL